jgi:hypothetical protein
MAIARLKMGAEPKDPEDFYRAKTASGSSTNSPFVRNAPSVLVVAKIGRRQRRRREIIEPTLEASASEAVKGGCPEKDDRAPAGRHKHLSFHHNKKSATLCLPLETLPPPAFLSSAATMAIARLKMGAQSKDPEDFYRTKTTSGSSTKCSVPQTVFRDAGEASHLSIRPHRTPPFSR